MVGMDQKRADREDGLANCKKRKFSEDNTVPQTAIHPIPGIVYGLSTSSWSSSQYAEKK